MDAHHRVATLGHVKRVPTPALARSRCDLGLACSPQAHSPLLFENPSSSIVLDSLPSYNALQRAFKILFLLVHFAELAACTELAHARTDRELEQSEG